MQRVHVSFWTVNPKGNILLLKGSTWNCTESEGSRLFLCLSCEQGGAGRSGCQPGLLGVPGWLWAPCRADLHSLSSCTPAASGRSRRGSAAAPRASPRSRSAPGPRRTCGTASRGHQRSAQPRARWASHRQEPLTDRSLSNTTEPFKYSSAWKRFYLPLLSECRGEMWLLRRQREAVSAGQPEYWEMKKWNQGSLNNLLELLLLLP